MPGVSWLQANISAAPVFLSLVYLGAVVCKRELCCHDLGQVARFGRESKTTLVCRFLRLAQLFRAVASRWKVDVSGLESAVRGGVLSSNVSKIPLKCLLFSATFVGGLWTSIMGQVLCIKRRGQCCQPSADEEASWC